MAAVLLLGLLFAAQMLLDYRKLVELNAAAPLKFATEGSYSQRVREGSLRIREGLMAIQERSVLLRLYAESLLAESGWDHFADKLALNERVMRFAPSSPVVYREALLLARADRQAEARVQMERAIWTFPEDFPAIRRQLDRLARLDQDATRFPALLEFSLQKYEEHQQAVPAK